MDMIMEAGALLLSLILAAGTLYSIRLYLEV
jgi:hypothetical protein